MIMRINEKKTLSKQVSYNVNINLVVENVTQVKNGILVNVHMRAKIVENIMCARTIILGIP